MILKMASATRYQTSAVEKKELARDELEPKGTAPPSNTNTTFPGNMNNPELGKRQFSLTTDWRTKTLHHLQGETTMRHKFESVQMLVLALKTLIPKSSTKTITRNSLIKWRFNDVEFIQITSETCVFSSFVVVKLSSIIFNSSSTNHSN